MRKIEFEEFLAVLDDVARHPSDPALTPETLLWGDLGLFGDDFDFILAGLFQYQRWTSKGQVNVSLYVPLDWEVGWFGRLKTTREIPDLTVRELYIFLETLEL